MAAELTCSTCGDTGMVHERVSDDEWEHRTCPACDAPLVCSWCMEPVFVNVNGLQFCMTHADEGVREIVVADAVAKGASRQVARQLGRQAVSEIAAAVAKARKDAGL